MRMKPFVRGRSFGDWITFYNGKYQVQVRMDKDNTDRDIVVLSIRREDRKPIMDWRDMQWIKNQLLGPEAEAVQLFPAESRLVDTSNQYYLTAYSEPGHRFPFGFIERAVTEKIRMVGPDGQQSNQRDFAPHVRPPDLEAQEERVVQMLKELGAECIERVIKDAVGEGPEPVVEPGPLERCFSINLAGSDIAALTACIEYAAENGGHISYDLAGLHNMIADQTNEQIFAGNKTERGRNL